MTGLRPHTRFASLRGTKQSTVDSIRVFDSVECRAFANAVKQSIFSILGLDCFVVPPRNDAKRQNGRRNTSPGLALATVGRRKHEALCSSGFMAFFDINDSAKLRKKQCVFQKRQKKLDGPHGLLGRPKKLLLLKPPPIDARYRTGPRWHDMGGWLLHIVTCPSGQKAWPSLHPWGR